MAELHDEHLLIGVACLGEELPELVDILLNQAQALVVPSALECKAGNLVLELLTEIVLEDLLKAVPVSEVETGDHTKGGTSHELCSVPLLHEGQGPENMQVVICKLVTAEHKVHLAGGEEGAPLIVQAIKHRGCGDLEGQSA